MLMFTKNKGTQKNCCKRLNSLWLPLDNDHNYIMKFIKNIFLRSFISHVYFLIIFRKNALFFFSRNSIWSVFYEKNKFFGYFFRKFKYDILTNVEERSKEEKCIRSKVDCTCTLQQPYTYYYDTMPGLRPIEVGRPSSFVTGTGTIEDFALLLRLLALCYSRVSNLRSAFHR